MIEIWAVVVLIVGIVSLFSGAYLALASAQQRKPIEQLRKDVDGHEGRIGQLERRDAGREQQVRNINDGIERIEKMLSEHITRLHP